MKAVMQPDKNIHPTAIVDPEAHLGSGVSVGPFSIIAAGARIGDNCEISSHVRIEGCVTMGESNRIFQGAVIGSEPQDLKYQGEDSRLEIGDRNCIREYATMNPGTGDNALTRIGSDCLLMAYSHIAHNCTLGDRVILANSVNLAGHVLIEDCAIIGGITPLHQFVHIGAHSIIGGGSRVPQDVLPFMRGAGNPLIMAGLNAVGLQRRGFKPKTLRNLRSAYRIFYRSGLNTSQALEQMEAEIGDDEHVRHIIDFVKNTERGIAK
ncbi:MAG: acyl-ACP--UDP-N-acetylglucosamine O-acyltransferase [bacterium]|nr:acyl-ACP--UDP-N-acetylglucosamine O-acyltransferase [bacterium]